MFYIITYDIPDDKRRTKLAKDLLDFGNRVQYSVFEAELDDTLFEKMLQRIDRVINPDEDSIRIYKLCKMCENNIQILGVGQRLHYEDIYII